MQLNQYKDNKDKLILMNYKLDNKLKYNNVYKINNISIINLHQKSILKIDN